MMPPAKTTGIASGFAQPVFDSQDAFRHALAALSRPGRIETLTRLPQGPSLLDPAAAALALTLFDFDSPVWLDSAAGNLNSEVFLRFHCGCPVVEEPRLARFALIGAASSMPRLAAFHPGDILYPDRSATVIIQLPSLVGGPPVALSGPGIATTASVAPRGLPDWFWSDWAVNGALYPQGVDVLLVAADAVLGLPRTVRAMSMHQEMPCTSR